MSQSTRVLFCSRSIRWSNGVCPSCRATAYRAARIGSKAGYQTTATQQKSKAKRTTSTGPTDPNLAQQLSGRAKSRDGLDPEEWTRVVNSNAAILKSVVKHSSDPDNAIVLMRAIPGCPNSSRYDELRQRESNTVTQIIQLMNV